MRTKLVDALVDGCIFLIILLERKNIDDGRKSLSNEAVVGVLGHHSAHGTSNVVSHAHLMHRQEGFKLLPQVRIQGEGLASVGRVQDDEADSVGSVGLGKRIRVTESSHKSLAKRLGEGSDGLAGVLGDLGDGTNSSRSVEILGGAGKLKDRLLKDLPKLAEGRTKSCSKANHDVQGGVDDEPIVLGRSSVNLRLLLVTKILLAGVGSGNDKTNDRHDLLKHAILSNQNSRATSLKCSSNVAVDIGNNGSVDQLAPEAHEQSAKL